MILCVCCKHLCNVVHYNGHVGNNSSGTRQTLGSAVIKLNAIFSSLALVFLGFQFIKAIIIAIKGLRAIRAKGISSFMQIIMFTLLGEVGEEKEEGANEEHPQHKGQEDIKVLDIESDSNNVSSVEKCMTTNQNTLQPLKIHGLQSSYGKIDDINLNDKLNSSSINLNLNNSFGLTLNDTFIRDNKVDQEASSNISFSVHPKIRDHSRSLSPFMLNNTGFGSSSIIKEQPIHKRDDQEQSRVQTVNTENLGSLTKYNRVTREHRRDSEENNLEYVSTINRGKVTRMKQN